MKKQITEDDQKRMKLTEAIKHDLSVGVGKYWKEVLCEPQPAFNEMAIWVLIYEDSDLYEVHKEFCEIIAPYIDPLKPLEIALMYNVIKQDSVYGRFTLKGEQAGLCALEKSDLGALNIRQSDTSTSIYLAKNSKYDK